jgi:hypothetical protein
MLSVDEGLKFIVGISMTKRGKLIDKKYIGRER